MSIPKLYSYILTSDDGSEPNPFWKVCTLSHCMSNIRKSAKKGDWIVGIRGKTLYNSMLKKEMKKNKDLQLMGNFKVINKIIYAMEILEPIKFDKYYEKYPQKHQNEKHRNKGRIYKIGDNIHNLKCKNEYDFIDPRTHKDEKCKDNPVENLVLVSKNFYYFGSEPIKIPKKLEIIVQKGRGYKCNFDYDTIKSFLEEINKHKPGVHAKPSDWDDDSGSSDDNNLSKHK